MKIIDLLNKIANGEEVPEKFKLAGQIFEKQGSCIEDEDGDSILCSIFTDFSNINEEIEIIKEDKKIEKLYYEEYEKLTYEIDKVCYLLRPINEIIDKINKMED